MKRIFLTICFLLFNLPVFSESVKIDNQFINSLAAESVVTRDQKIMDMIDKQINAKGYVFAAKDSKLLTRYVITIMLNTGSIEMKINLYTDRDDYLKLLQKGDQFEFKGKLISFSPVNTEKSSYILNVLLEEGSVIVE